MRTMRARRPLTILRDAREHGLGGDRASAASTRGGSPPPSGDQKKKAGAERLYGEARQKVGALEITAPAGAEVFVDGKKIGKAPLADPVYVDPGPHKVTAQEGDKRGETEARALASETSKVDVQLTESGVAPPPVTTPPGGEQTSEGPPLWPGFVLAGAGLVGVGVGIGLFAAGSSANSDADAIADEIAANSSSCNPPTGPSGARCADGEDKQSTAQSLGLGSAIAIGAGSALTIGGAVYLIWAFTSEPEASSAVNFQPWIAPGVGGGAVRGSF